VNTGNSYAKLILNFQRLVVRATEHEAELPYACEVKLELAAQLQELKDIKERQQNHLSAWKQASKELRQSMTACRSLAGRLRYAVKAAWGRSDPRLVEFDVKPFRPRGAHAPKVNGCERPM
jgi:hypothetical protein